MECLLWYIILALYYVAIVTGFGHVADTGRTTGACVKGGHTELGVYIHLLLYTTRGDVFVNTQHPPLACGLQRADLYRLLGYLSASFRLVRHPL